MAGTPRRRNGDRPYSDDAGGLNKNYRRRSSSHAYPHRIRGDRVRSPLTPRLPAYRRTGHPESRCATETSIASDSSSHVHLARSMPEMRRTTATANRSYGIPRLAEIRCLKMAPSVAAWWYSSAVGGGLRGASAMPVPEVRSAAETQAQAQTTSIPSTSISIPH